MVRDKKLKQKIEVDEKLEAMGQEDEEKAAKWVIEENQNIELKREKDYNDTLTFFDKKRKKFSTYYEAIANLLNNLLDHYVDWIPGFHHETTVNQARGVGVILKTPDNQLYARGFKPCGEPKYDLHAIKVLIWQTENVIDEYQRQTGGQDLGESEDLNGDTSQELPN